MKNSKLIISSLNDLLAINYYLEKIYLDALNEVKQEDLKHFCRAMAFERSEFCRYIGAEVTQLGGKPEYPDHIKRKSDILWSNFKYAICVNNTDTLVGELIRIKTWSIDKYETCLKNVVFPSHIYELLVKQKTILEKRLTAVQSNDETFNQFLRTAS